MQVQRFPQTTLSFSNLLQGSTETYYSHSYGLLQVNINQRKKHTGQSQRVPNMNVPCLPPWERGPVTLLLWACDNAHRVALTREVRLSFNVPTVHCIVMVD